MRSTTFPVLAVVLHAWLGLTSASPDTLLNGRQSSSVNATVSVLDGDRNVTIAVPLQAVPNVEPGQSIKPGSELRILCIGDSITVGTGSTGRNGYRQTLEENLSGDDVVFAGTEKGGTMEDGYFAAWAGKTIQFMSDNVNASLTQMPNIVLLHAGTNDMNPAPQASVEGSDPVEAAGRLGQLIDEIVAACPDAVVLVALIINSCSPIQKVNVEDFQTLIPGVVQSRLEAGKHVLAVDFAELGDDILSSDCVHPDDQGYSAMGDQWYNFMTQIPKSWIQAPTGDDPTRETTKALDDGDKAGDVGSAAWLGRAAPFWVLTAMAIAWHGATWMTA